LFVNPQIVIIDEDFLTTLNDREYNSGIAEIIKYGLTYDTNLIDYLKTFEKSTINKIIHRSIEIKNEIVLKDPREKGLRKVLNFGHTLGHAIESYFLENNNKDSLTHGEAIAIGMVCESYLSYKVLKLPIEKLIVIKNMISTMYEKVTIQQEDYAAIFELLKHDKKNNNGEVNFVLLNDFEEFKLDCKISNKLLIESIEYYNS
jgi:3-dehydroquinate synthase